MQWSDVRDSDVRDNDVRVMQCFSINPIDYRHMCSVPSYVCSLVLHWITRTLKCWHITTVLGWKPTLPTVQPSLSPAQPPELRPTLPGCLCSRATCCLHQLPWQPQASSSAGCTLHTHRDLGSTVLHQRNAQCNASCYTAELINYKLNYTDNNEILAWSKSRQINGCSLDHLS